MLGKPSFRRNGRGIDTEQRCLRRRPSAPVRRSGYPSGQKKSAPSADRDANVAAVLSVASRIASMADRDVRQRHHDLVDKGMGGELTALERFELERIETRLDAEDRDPQIEARDREWEVERSKLLDSIEDLLTRLRP
jgi:hypothetical protein